MFSFFWFKCHMSLLYEEVKQHYICLLFILTFPNRPSLTPTTTPRTSTMISPFWSCLPQYRWHPVCLLCAWPPLAPASPLEPHVSPLGGARPAKPVSEQLFSKSYLHLSTHMYGQFNFHKGKYKGTAKYLQCLTKTNDKRLIYATSLIFLLF